MSQTKPRKMPTRKILPLAFAFRAEAEISPSAGHWHQSNRTFGHGYARNASDAAIKSLKAGLDLELTCCGADEVSQAAANRFEIDPFLRTTLNHRAKRVLYHKGRNPYLSGEPVNVVLAANLPACCHVPAAVVRCSPPLSNRSGSTASTSRTSQRPVLYDTNRA